MKSTTSIDTSKTQPATSPPSKSDDDERRTETKQCIHIRRRVSDGFWCERCGLAETGKAKR